MLDCEPGPANPGQYAENDKAVPNPDVMAKRCAEAMLKADKASQVLGMKLISVAPGQAEMSMTVREDMVNGHNVCHGGFIFTLADSAFAFACNTYNQSTLAQSCEITFLKPVLSGDRLTALAHEVWREGRSGVYDIEVTNQSGTKVALFRGKSRTIKGEVIAICEANSNMEH
ncbi:MAG: hydroxyphenylacetyl-CoA thioesterase PaaI [Fimbriimonadaceae bacterium]|nr:hydroxyphenylacetyl-CoA thioesterase PaaI [Alphaproteobacteria bacterium]